MTLPDRMNQPVVRHILTLLRQNHQTLAQLTDGVDFSAEEITDALNALLADGLIDTADNGYLLDRFAFERLNALLTEYGGAAPNAADESLFLQYFTQRESDFRHAAFDGELAFYEGIRSGNLEVVRLLLTPLGGEGYGILSKDPLQNLKYHLVITIAMITRFCVNGGMTPEEAYNLSDVYVMKTDLCRTEAEVHKTHTDVIVDFTKRMRQRKNGNVYTKPIILTLDYISDHLHHKITIQDAASELGLSVPYLSRLFKSEVGVTFSEFIAIKKIEAAANMLQFSGYTSSEISTLLHFSSQSYFIKVFQKHTGMTPKEYKNRYYSSDWSIFQPNREPEQTP